MINLTLPTLLSLLSEKNSYKLAMNNASQKYSLKIYKVEELTPQKVSQLYQILTKKFYLVRKNTKEDYWYENQLRIFIWVLVGYIHIKSIQLLDLKEQDWLFFSSVFNYRSFVFYEYQSLSLVKSKQKAPKWNSQEIFLLESIISTKTEKNRWNSIARQLFIRSNKKYYRNSKQCRQRWINHMDPAKIRTEWTIAQDLALINCIRQNGKKWSAVVKELKNTRTEHAVKNRYKSLISIESKKNIGKKQSQLQNILFKRISNECAKEIKSLLLINEQQKQKQQIKQEVISVNYESQCQFFSDEEKQDAKQQMMFEPNYDKLDYDRQRAFFQLEGDQFLKIPLMIYKHDHHLHHQEGFEGSQKLDHQLHFENQSLSEI